jgi:hypothetical protein
MRTSYWLTAIMLACSLGLAAQEIVTVKAGTKIIQAFPKSDRYLYPEFSDGVVMFKDSTFTAARMNYDILYGEIEFISKKDTLQIMGKKDIRYVSVNSDTFYYDKGYLRQLAGNANFMLAEHRFVKIVDNQKQGAYGTTSSTSAVSSYNSLPSSGGYYNLVVNEDLLLKKVVDLYLYTPAGGFDLFRRKNFFSAFPEKEEELKKYLKEQPVDFNKRDDLIRLTRYATGSR